MSSSHVWRCRGHSFVIGRRPLVLGIVNVTPDSFSDGGQHATTDTAVDHALRLVNEGADLLDVGGESTRPGSQPVPLDEELARVVPVVRELTARSTVPISVDTSKPEVARQALAAGAVIVNDVTGLRDPEMIKLVAQTGAGAIVMHMQGTPATMQVAPTYADVVAEVGAFFEERLHALAAAGIAPEFAALDPGIGFGKTEAHNLALLAGLERYQRFGRPVCLGVSRKGTLSRLAGGGRPVGERLPAGLAVTLFAQARGAVQIARVHDVRATRDAVTVFAAIDEERLRQQP